MATPSDTPTPAPRRALLRRLAARRLRRAELIYFAVLVLFAALAVLSHRAAYFGWDVAGAQALQQWPVPGLRSVMLFVSFFGNDWHPFALTTATCLLFLARGWRTEAAGLILSAGGGSLINTLIKLLVARPRPSATLVAITRLRHTQSFPSGHVTFYVCYFGFLFFVAYAVLPKGTRGRGLALTCAALPVATVGLARVYLGEHWPSDALGAYLLSGLWLATAVHLYRTWKQRSTFHPEDEAGAQEKD